jgi:hypothetical protein
VLSLALSQVSCSHWREAYLNDSLGHATQEDIREKLGPPHMAKESLLDGDAVWSYRYALTERELHPWNIRYAAKGAAELGNSAAALIGKGQEGSTERIDCYRYDLKFDQTKVLRQWKREPC